MFEGRCECGSVRYRVTGAIHDFSHCHCSQCRRLHGAAFASFVGVARSHLQYLGDHTELASYASSDTHERLFCRSCGSSIGVLLTTEPDDIYLAMGTVEGDPPRPPAYHIFVDSKAPWHEILDSAPQFAEFPADDEIPRNPADN